MASYLIAKKKKKKLSRRCGNSQQSEEIITPRSADEALALWIRGQQTRAGTLQYIALSDELRG